MAEPNLTTVEQLLDERGLSQLLPVSFGAHRLGCTVWTTRVFRKYGDVDAQILIYDLKDEPESIVDLEEEITALTDEGSPRTLVREVRDDQWGILITCAVKESAIVERALAETETDESTPTYHPQLDRILDGDFFHQVNGHWIKACLSSIERAMLIKDLLHRAEEVYEVTQPWPERIEGPLPALLAVLQIPSIPLPGAPASYNELAQSQFVIESPEVIQIAPPQGEAELTLFARQLFGLLGAEHRAGIGFSRDAGCCLRPEFLLRNGVLTDVYFMVDLEKVRSPDETKLRDIWNAMLVTCDLANNDAKVASRIVSEAKIHYTGNKKVDRNTTELIEGAVEGYFSGLTQGLEALVNMLL